MFVWLFILFLYVVHLVLVSILNLPLEFAQYAQRLGVDKESETEEGGEAV